MKHLKSVVTKKMIPASYRNHLFGQPSVLQSSLFRYFFASFTDPFKDCSFYDRTKAPDFLNDTTVNFRNVASSLSISFYKLGTIQFDECFATRGSLEISRSLMIEPGSMSLDISLDSFVYFCLFHIRHLSIIYHV